MTIDEHIENCKSRIEEYKEVVADLKVNKIVDDRYKPFNMEEALMFEQEELDLLKELRWYREQELIRREDVSYVFYDEPILDTDGTCYGVRTPSMATLQERILKIPKAEPQMADILKE